jgi:tRNA (adenine37-N6)-methyltransferase
MILKEIAYFHSPFTSKFGVPKQSGLVDELEGTIEFASEFRNKDMLRGIEDFDYLWIIWQFSANPHAATSPLVRPPLLGGNEKVGVFASRSPFRPNAISFNIIVL